MKSFLSALIGALVLAAPVSANELGRTWFDIEPYKPTYFLFGRPDSKVQFSAKLRFVPTLPLYFGYTQLMKWELFFASAPIRDVNFNPELFYRWYLRPKASRNDENPEPPEWVDWGLYEHESNGRDGAESRAWDRASVRYVRGWRIGERAQLVASIKLNVPIRIDVTTPRFLWYRGLFEGEVAWIHFLSETFEESELRLRFFTAGSTYVEPFAGGQELTLRFKPRSSSFLPTFYAQLFHGYGENLLDYDRERLAFRLGLGF